MRQREAATAAVHELAEPRERRMRKLATLLRILPGLSLIANHLRNKSRVRLTLCRVDRGSIVRLAVDPECDALELVVMSFAMIW
jgi:hypothetical protein